MVRGKDTKPRKKYVTYEEVEKGLFREGLVYSSCTPTYYLRYLRAVTGLSDAKLAHDLRADSGCDVAVSTVRLWRKERV